VINIKQFDYLTSLRGLAALWVILYHISTYLADYLPEGLFLIVEKGYLAVDFFFILSGFILTLNYSKTFNHFCYSEVKVFLIKRIARIYPLHLFVLFVYLLIPLAYFVTNKELPGEEKYSIANYIFHFFLINNWGISNQLSWNIPAWSISTEWAAYLLFPFFMVLVSRIKAKMAPFVLANICIFIYSVFCFFEYDSLGQEIPKLGLLRCLLEFLIGVLICKIAEKYTYGNRFSYIILVAALITIMLIIFNILNEVLFAPISLSLLLIALINLNKSNLVTILRLRPFMLLGEMSYSIYLVHYLIKDIFKLLFLEEKANLMWILSYIFTVLLVSYITYLKIEMPSRKALVSFFIK